MPIKILLSQAANPSLKVFLKLFFLLVKGQNVCPHLTLPRTPRSPSKLGLQLKAQVTPVWTVRAVMEDGHVMKTLESGFTNAWSEALGRHNHFSSL